MGEVVGDRVVFACDSEPSGAGGPYVYVDEVCGVESYSSVGEGGVLVGGKEQLERASARCLDVGGVSG